jgi:hypothetical protein
MSFTRRLERYAQLGALAGRIGATAVAARVAGRDPGTDDPGLRARAEDLARTLGKLRGGAMKLGLSLAIAADEASGTLRLDAGIPRVEHAVVLELRCGGIGLPHRRHGPELAERVAELGAHAVDCLLEADRPEFLRAQALDHRQQKLVAFVSGRKPLVFEEVPKLGHVVGFDAENPKGFQQSHVLRSLDAFGKVALA